jgi:hypothetical protein
MILQCKDVKTSRAKTMYYCVQQINIDDKTGLATPRVGYLAPLHRFDSPVFIQTALFHCDSDAVPVLHDQSFTFLSTNLLRNKRPGDSSGMSLRSLAMCVSRMLSNASNLMGR